MYGTGKGARQYHEQQARLQRQARFSHSMPTHTLLIRADASATIGVGHVMRMLALGEAVVHGHELRCEVACASLPEPIATMIQSAGIAVHRLDVAIGSPEDAQATAALAKRLGAPAVVLDGYQFHNAYQESLKREGLAVVLVDDVAAADSYSADVIVNHNPYATPDMYLPRSGPARLLLGARYVLLRREFLPWKGFHRDTPRIARNLLVTFGGADSNRNTEKALEAIRQLEQPIHAKVVVGQANPRFASLAARGSNPDATIEVVQAGDGFPELLAWADMALGAAGTTTWELAFMGVPSVLMPTADNQLLVARTAEEKGIAINLGWHDEVTSEMLSAALNALSCNDLRRREMSQRGQALIDGLGAERVAHELADTLLPHGGPLPPDSGRAEPRRRTRKRLSSNPE